MDIDNENENKDSNKKSNNNNNNNSNNDDASILDLGTLLSQLNLNTYKKIKNDSKNDNKLFNTNISNQLYKDLSKIGYSDDVLRKNIPIIVQSIFAFI